MLLAGEPRGDARPFLERAVSVHDLVAPERVDEFFAWPPGRAASLARRKKLPHYVLPDGSLRLRLAEVTAFVRFVPVAVPAKSEEVAGA